MLQNLARHDDELLASYSSEKFACMQSGGQTLSCSRSCCRS
jgi:hypothetical protein